MERVATAERPRIAEHNGPIWSMELADAGLLDLELNRLLVVLAPAPRAHFDGHKVRAVTNRNPEWYRELYHRRRFGVKRGRVIAALKRIACGKEDRRGYEKETLVLLWQVRRKLGTSR